MASDTTAQLNGTGYSGEPITKVPAWHELVAVDLLLNNLTTGLFLSEAVGELMAPEVFKPLAILAYPLALAFLLADLLCLVLDLGDPLRFHHMLRIFKPTSPMSLGTWSLTVYSVPLTVIAGLSLLPVLLPAEVPALEWVRKIAVICGLLPALGSAAYKGVLLSTNSQPGWRDARWLGGYLTNSAMMLGCAVLVVLAIVWGQPKAMAVVHPALVLLMLLNAIVLFLLILDLRPALTRIFPVRQLWSLGLLTIGGGMLIPLYLLFVRGGTATMLSAVLLLLLGSMAIRLVIIKIPHALADHPRSATA
jgi:Polysulphide reductase, NrfD